jgi:hypothetical protein
VLKKIFIRRPSLLSCVLAAFLSFISTSAQTASQKPAATPSPAAPEVEQDVVRITTNLVQIDVLVTDKDGNQVTDLTANDFELLQDGKPQKLTSFAYINTSPPTQTAPIVSKENSNKAIVSPPVRVRPGNAGRPDRVCYPTDWLFTSCGSPPHIAASQ